MRLLPVGEDSLLVELSGTGEATAVYAEARRREVAAVEVVPAARTVLFEGVADRDALAAELPGWSLSLDAAVEGRLVEVPTVYDGADLEDVARRWGMSVEEAVATHSACEMVVAFCGFAPGFAYCTGLPAALAVPRLPSPRPRVPAGSVAVADVFTGVYPAASPGGWRLLGHTDLALWDAARPEPALLAPGTRVRFVEVAR